MIKTHNRIHSDLLIVLIWTIMTFISVIIKQGTDMKLEFLLFTESNFSSPFRELHLWVNTT